MIEIHIVSGVGDPVVRVRGEVRVVREDLARRHVCVELNEQALRTDPDVQRIEGLDLVELLGAKKVLAERRLAEVDEGVAERVAAKPASVDTSRVRRFRLSRSSLPPSNPR